MGQKEYTAAVDIWSVGCIMAEMLQGRPVFTGLCDIDQLFQIFYKMGTPTTSTWAGFANLPHYQSSIFPVWPPVISNHYFTLCFIIFMLLEYRN